MFKINDIVYVNVYKAKIEDIDPEEKQNTESWAFVRYLPNQSNKEATMWLQLKDLTRVN